MADRGSRIGMEVVVGGKILQRRSRMEKERNGISLGVG